MPGALLVPPAFRLWTTKAEPPHLSQSQAGAVQPVQAAVSVTDLAVEGAGFLATIDADGYATIIGREKDLIINAAGKNMSPANIEGAVAGDSPLIAQVAGARCGPRKDRTGPSLADPADVATQNNPICARQLTIAEKPPPVQLDGSGALALVRVDYATLRT